MALLGTQTVLVGCSCPSGRPLAGVTAGRKWRGKIDEDLVCIISDMHTNPGGYQPEKLERTLDEILRLNPRPANIIALGDLAYLTGRPEEYARLKEILSVLDGSGITLTMAMGNHDRREHFAEVFPEYAAKSLLSDRFVYVVETPKADFIVLDSLQQGDDDTTWITPGALDDNQREWLQNKLSEYTEKPVFVTAHHPINETGIKAMLVECPSCCGYIHGHDHEWRPGWRAKNYSELEIIRTLCVPSTGHWGDIGYVLVHLEENQARVDLREFEFFFPRPLREGETRPPQWDEIEKERRGASCTFPYRHR